MTAPISNSSISLFPSSSDLLMAFPRLGNSLVDLLGFGDFSWFSNATQNDSSQVLTGGSGFLNWTSPAAAGAPSAGSTLFSSVMDGLWLSISRVSNFDGIFSYLWSKWAITTILMAAILNRAHIFASTREPVYLTWKSRLLLRFIPIILLLSQAITLLQALDCQTGMQLPRISFKDSKGVINKSWVTSPGLLHNVTSTLLFWQGSEDSCRAVGMIPTAEDSLAWNGSTVFLWPLFLVLGASQLAENVASALKGQQPRSETGMTVFEHSLAFAEAETVARAAVGIGLFGLPRSAGDVPNAQESESASTGKFHTFTRAMILQKLNVPPEVLIICLITCCSHLSSQLLGVAGKQSRYRLLNTTIWGISFLALFAYSFAAYSRPSALEDVQIIRYPTVCIIGFVPHLVTILGAAICAQVYIFAIGSALLSPPPQWKKLSLKERLLLAHDNMSAGNSWTKIHWSRHDDFYQVILRLGYQMLMAAAEAVYFNEGLQVTLNPRTWLEQARYDEATKSGVNCGNLAQPPLELQHDFAGGDGFGLTDEPPQTGPDGRALPSGYARERKTMTSTSKSSSAAMQEEGVGISQRSGRWTMSWRMLEQTSELLSFVSARCMIGSLQRVSQNRFAPPKWLLQAARINPPPAPLVGSDTGDGFRKQVVKFWRYGPKGDMQEAKDGDDWDVETEERRRLAKRSKYRAGLPEADVDESLYNWWKKNGWWGERDDSDTYRPPLSSILDDDWDKTSQITQADSSGWETESMSSAASDETIVPVRSRRRALSPSASGPDNLDDETNLWYEQYADLLDPKTLEQKQAARLLAQRMRHSATNDGPMTRSRYQKSVLGANLHKPPAARNPLLGPEDEALMLDHLIKERRQGAQASSSGTSWRQGGAGMGEGGPQCAVCHSAPRSVLVWPCRCLSLCEDCRVSLAENNFATCVCCRRDVVAFSRLYVP